MFRTILISLLIFVYLVECHLRGYYDAVNCGRVRIPNLRGGLKSFPFATNLTLPPEGNGSHTSSIKGGVVVDSEAVPFTVVLNIPNGKHSVTCGGTLISSRHVVTAAHCIRNHDAGHCAPHDSKYIEHTMVYVGATCRNSNAEGCDSTKTGIKIPIASYYGHENFFKRNCVTNDILLLELAHDVPPEYPHICLPHRHPVLIDPHAKHTLYASGFGRNPDIDHGTHAVDHLYFADLGKEIAGDACVSQGIKARLMGFVCNDQMVTNVCKGDSGTGVFQVIDDKAYLRAWVSFGSKCTDIVWRNTGHNVDLYFYTRMIDFFTQYIS